MICLYFMICCNILMICTTMQYYCLNSYIICSWRVGGPWLDSHANKERLAWPKESFLWSWSNWQVKPTKGHCKSHRQLRQKMVLEAWKTWVETLLETPSFLDKFNHVHQIPNTCNDRPSLNPSIFWCHPTWHHEKVFGIIPNASTEPQTDVWWLLMIII